MTRLLFLGRLRDVAGRGEHVVTLPAHIETVADLRAWLASEDAELGAALQGRGIHVVVDQVISNRDTESVRRADEIAFMPPLSGG
jgi:molybdopterin synthase sulfur carrier subunit